LDYWAISERIFCKNCFNLSLFIRFLAK